MTSYGMNTQEGGAMCQVLDECAQTLATTHRGGIGRDPIAFNWYVGGNSPAVGDGAVSPTLTRGRASASDVHAVVIEEG